MAPANATDASQDGAEASQPSQWAWPFQEQHGPTTEGSVEKLADGTTLQMAGTQLAKQAGVPGILQFGMQIGRTFEQQDTTIRNLKRRIELLEIPDDSAAARGPLMEA